MSGTNNTTAKQTELQKSKIFMTALNELMGIVDDISKEMTDEQYLNASNAMKRLYDNKITIVNNIMQTPIVREHERRVRQNRPARVYLTDEQRILGGKATRCRKCDRCIKRLSVRCSTTDIQKYLPIINAIRRWSMNNGKEYHL